MRSYATYSGLTLSVDYSGGTNNEPDVTVLGNGDAVTSIAGSQGSWRNFKVNLPSGTQGLTVTLSGGSGGADLYVRNGSKPTTSAYDYRPYPAATTRA